MTTYLTRIVHFSAAHRYFRPEWSEEQNRKTFGPCANPHGHGHDYALEVTVAGVPDPLTGFSVDLARLDQLLETEVRGRLDHQHINHAVMEFAPGGLVPSTENLVIWIWRQLNPKLEGAQLVRLRLREGPGLLVDYYGSEERAALPHRFDV